MKTKFAATRTTKLLNVILIVLAFSASTFSEISLYANERIRSRSELIQEGYAPIYYSTSTKLSLRAASLYSPHSLVWPVTFQDARHSVANSMAQFQPFGDPYFHGGCDLRVVAGEKIVAPVEGRLEAGHYSYDTLPNGSLQKYFKPWPAQGEPLYFEVALVLEDGTRFEFHHVNRRTLPPAIVSILNSGKATVVPAGTVLGYAVTWPDGVYHHVHYNIILPDGSRLNPEYASVLLPDHMAPLVSGVYAKTPNGKVLDFGKGIFNPAPTEFIVAVVDHFDDDAYDHPPTYLSLKFVSGLESLWDFRTTLTDSQGVFPNLWSFFLDSLRIPTGQTIETDGGYGTGHSLIRLTVPGGASGPFTIDVGDIAGNVTTFQGVIN